MSELATRSAQSMRSAAFVASRARSTTTATRSASAAIRSATSGVGRGVGLERQGADRLLDAVAPDDDRPRGRARARSSRSPRRSSGCAPAAASWTGWSAAADRRLEGRHRRRPRSPASASEREPALLGIPEVRRGPIGAGRAQADLEQLVERGVGIAAARDRADRREEQGVGAQGGARSYDRPGGPSIERPIERARACSLSAPGSARIRPGLYSRP